MDKEIDEFQKLIFSFLKAMNFRIVGYFPYGPFVDIVGYIGPRKPLRIPTKAMIEITTVPLRESEVERFYKVSKDALADKHIIFSIRKAGSGVRRLASRYRIELLSKKEVKSAVGKIDEQASKQYREISHIVSPYNLARCLSDLAHQKIPLQLKSFAEQLDLEPWKVFEQAVYSIFSHCFNYNVRQLGSECLFEREPEGVVVVSNRDFAFVYECKSAEDAYQMTVDDERAYVEYINKKKNEIRSIDNSELKYFVIVSPDFKGELWQRRDNIYGKTSVLVIFFKASALKILGEWAFNVPSNLKGLIDLRNIFRTSLLVVPDSEVQKEIKDFERKYRPRW